MGFSCGVVGLPNAGKSTLFNALTQAGSAVASYAFCTIDPKEGRVAVPDERLAQLAALLLPPKVTETSLTFVDIAGLVKGAHAGEGLGNRFLARIREVDAIAHVVRLFDSGEVSHVHEKVDPIADYEVVQAELMLADLESVTRKRDKAEKMAKVGDKEAKRQLDLLHRLEASLARGIPASRVKARDDREAAVLANLFLLTLKPELVVANLSEDQLERAGELVHPLVAHLADSAVPVVPICGKFEFELVELPLEDRQEFMRDLGVERLALEKVVLAGYGLLDLLTFYTTVGAEMRAWTVPRGTLAASAAGRIHTDMEQGFIKAEIIPVDVLLSVGSEAAVRQKGLARTEGRDYKVRDGDVVYFHFR